MATAGGGGLEGDGVGGESDLGGARRRMRVFVGGGARRRTRVWACRADAFGAKHTFPPTQNAIHRSLFTPHAPHPPRTAAPRNC